MRCQILMVSLLKMKLVVWKSFIVQAPKFMFSGVPAPYSPFTLWCPLACSRGGKRWCNGEGNTVYLDFERGGRYGNRVSIDLLGNINR